MSATLPLPPALQPWHAWLAWFDPDIAALLGDWLVRLEPLLGRGAARMQHGAADPDGIDDLRRRGPYARLLLSEWAVADLLPDEFLRRAAHHEHLFLAPKLVQRQSDALVLALFDAGPAQRGAPRLLHVAMWILLARRAQAARARFAWGVLQRPGEVQAADAPHALRALLQARTHQPATDAERSAWRAYLRGSGQAASERWWIAATQQDAGMGDHSVVVRQDFDGRLRVAIGSRHAHRELALAVPPAPCAARLLRGDFIAPPPPAVAASGETLKGRVSLRQPPLFSSAGHYVALPLAGEQRAVVLQVPREGRYKKAAPRYSAWTSGTELLCGVIAHKEFAGVVAMPVGLYFWKMPGFLTVARPPADVFAAVPGTARWLHCAWLKGGAKQARTQRVVILDGAGRLLSWTNASTRPGRDTPAHALVDDAVLAMQQIDAQRLVYARYASGHLRISCLHREGTTQLLTQLTAPSRPTQLVFRGGVRDGQWQGGICLEYRGGQRDGARTCRLYQGGPQDGYSELELVPPPGWKLLGLVPDPQRSERSQLLMLRQDRRTLVALGEHGQEILFQSPCDISVASVSFDGASVALVDLEGQVLLLGDGGRRVLLRMRGQRGGERDG
jgi:hypothetical protein